MLELLAEYESQIGALIDSLPNAKRYDLGWIGDRIIFEDLVTERVHTKINGVIIQLDKSLPARLNPKHRHYHYRPAAVKVISGFSTMEIGSGNLDSAPKVVELVPGYVYEMVRREDWHNIAPTTELYSIGVMGEEWKPAPRNILKDLRVERLTEAELETLKEYFRERI